MAHIPLPDNVTGMRALLAFRPEIAPPIVDLTNTLLHAPNSLTRGERELIAAYVSSLNDCTFCHDSHAVIASCHLNEDETFVDSVIANPAAAAVSDKLKALLAIAACVQQGGTRVQPGDVEHARRNGATDVEIHDTVLIAAVFCMFNRYVDGLGAGETTDPRMRRERARLVAEHGYNLSLPQQPTAQ